MMDNLIERVVMSAQIVRRTLGEKENLQAYRKMLYDRLTAQHLNLDCDVVVRRDTSDFERETVLDMILEKALLIELRTLPSLEPIHDQQMVTYLEIGGLARGLLINFSQDVFRRGIRRYRVPAGSDHGLDQEVGSC